MYSIIHIENWAVGGFLDTALTTSSINTIFSIYRIERDDIVGLSERRQAEIERLHAKIQELTEEVSRAVAGKCEAQARLEDIDAKEMNLTFKQKRLDEEKKFLGSQIQLLQVC